MYKINIILNQINTNSLSPENLPIIQIKDNNILIKNKNNIIKKVENLNIFNNTFEFTNNFYNINFFFNELIEGKNISFIHMLNKNIIQLFEVFLLELEKYLSTKILLFIFKCSIIEISENDIIIDKLNNYKNNSKNDKIFLFDLKNNISIKNNNFIESNDVNDIWQILKYLKFDKSNDLIVTTSFKFYFRDDKTTTSTFQFVKINKNNSFKELKKLKYKKYKLEYTNIKNSKTLKFIKNVIFGKSYFSIFTNLEQLEDKKEETEWLLNLMESFNKIKLNVQSQIIKKKLNFKKYENFIKMLKINNLKYQRLLEEEKNKKIKKEDLNQNLNNFNKYKEEIFNLLKKENQLLDFFLKSKIFQRSMMKFIIID